MATGDGHFTSSVGNECSL